jgi:hypothetical protein
MQSPESLTKFESLSNYWTDCPPFPLRSKCTGLALKGTSFHRLRKNSVLYQRTTLVVPYMIENVSGFQPVH